DALDLMAGASAPVATGRLGAVLMRALPARRRIGVGEGAGLLRAAIVFAKLVEAGGAVGIAVAAVGIAAVLHLDMGFRQFIEKARGDGRLPQAVDAAVGNEP